jgi:transcription elongation factor Spt5
MKIKSAVIFLKNGSKILLLRRGTELEGEGKWDGISLEFGEEIVDVDEKLIEAVKLKINRATKISLGSVTYIRHGEVIEEKLPILFKTDDANITKGGGYDDHEWIDTGEINNYDLFGGEVLKNLLSQVHSFVYLVRAVLKKEGEVARSISAKIGENNKHIYSILVGEHLPGYVIVESNNIRSVERVTKGIRNCKGIVGAEANFGEILEFLKPSSQIHGFGIGDHVEVTDGPFKGEPGEITELVVSKEKLTVMLTATPIPLPITVTAEQVKMVEEDA